MRPSAVKVMRAAKAGRFTTQRTQIVEMRPAASARRDLKINRIAVSMLRGQRTFGAGGNVSNGDGNDMPAGISLVGVRAGMDCIVRSLGLLMMVGGKSRQLAALRRCRHHLLCFFKHVWENMRDFWA